MKLYALQQTQVSAYPSETVVKSFHMYLCVLICPCEYYVQIVTKMYY